jgi:hypothetical protein
LDRRRPIFCRNKLQPVIRLRCLTRSRKKWLRQS